MPDAADVPNLIRRWRADSIGLANGAAVSSWTDSVASLAVTQASGTEQPSYVTSGAANGQPCVRFDSDRMAATGLSTVAQPITMVAVVDAVEVNNTRQAVYFGTELLIEAGLWSMWGGAQLNGATANTGLAVVTGVYNGASSSNTLNGGTPATGNAGTSGLDVEIMLGNHPYVLSRVWSGDIYELLVYSRALSAGERATVHSYVQDRYGITVADYVSSAVKPTYVSDRGTAANATAATTSSVTLTSPTTIAVGNYLIARVAVDNSGSSGAAPGCTVTDPRSNAWTVLGPALVDPGAVSAGATAYIAYTRVVTAYQAADALTFNWGGISTTAKAIVVEEWKNIHPTSPVAVSAVTANAAASTAVTVSITPTAPNQLVYTCLATEGIAGDTVGADADSTNGTWSTLTTTASANATATNNQRVSGQYKVVTAAGAQSWDSTITSRDWAALIVSFAPPAFPPPVWRVVREAVHRSHYW